MSTSILKLAMEATETAIESLALSGVADANILQLSVLTDSPKELPAAAFPCILIAPLGTEVIRNSTNKSEEVGYPVGVVILDAANQTQVTNLDARVLWREQIIDHFIHNRTISGIHNDLYDVTIEPNVIIDPGAWFDKQLFASALILRFWVHKTRRA